jgi:pyrroline-5-carboxylate reductase
VKVTSNINILTFGYGNMGKAILKNFINQKNYQISVIDPNLTSYDKKDNLNFYNSISELEKDFSAKIILLAVKPQAIDKVISDIKKFITKDNFVISMLAGIETSYFEKNLTHSKIIRIMPNIAASISASCNFTFAKNLDQQEKQFINNFIEKFGQIFWLEKEESFHAATSASGSGIAYFFQIFEYFEAYLLENNYSADMAKNIILQTAKSAAELASRSDHSFAQLKSQVTSKNGTTAAALDSFSQNNLADIFKQALKAAEQRSKDLAK